MAVLISDKRLGCLVLREKMHASNEPALYLGLGLSPSADGAPLSLFGDSVKWLLALDILFISAGILTAFQSSNADFINSRKQ